MKPRLLLMAVMLTGAAAALKASPAPADIWSNAAERAARYKQIQQERLMREPLAERRELAERFQAWKKTHRKQLAAGKHVPSGAERLRPDADTPALRETRAARATRLAHVASPSRVAALASNQRVNDPSMDLDPSTTAQSEVSIAADGQNVVVTWNDGEGLNYAPPRNAQGYGWSTDGGITWTDGGAPPPPTGLIWYSDPVVVVNLKSHKFYFSALVVDSSDFSFGQNGVGVIQGSFSGGVFRWGTPVVAIQAAANTKIYDKEWMAVDSTSGNVYVSYVDFFVGGDQIEFKRSTDAGATFPTTLVLSSSQDQGYVQAPRVVVGPTGEVYVAWYAIGNGVTSAWARDYYRIKKSLNSGLTFGSQATLDSAFVDFGNGAPGFNRGNSFAFPSLAVDNTTGAHRSRVYATWNESVDFYWDDLGYHAVGVTEPPDFGNTASAAHAISIGDLIHGNILSSDEDWFKFTGAKDSTVIIFCDSLKSTLQGAMELRGPDGVQQLAYVSSGQARDPLLIVYTLPQTATYYIRLRGLSSSLGAYAMGTGYHIPKLAPLNDRARDHRDVMLKYADAPSGAWPATTVRVNSDPANFDEWLPEVAVGGNGKPYVAWYDFHDYSGGSFPGSGSTTYLSRSDDGGTTWAAGSPVSGVTTYWWNVASNIAPNQGDYIALHGTPTGVLVGWGDGRDGDPNVYFANVDLAFVAVSVSLASATVEPGRVNLVWQVADASTFTATLERRVESGDWATLTTLIADGTGRMTYDDASVSPGRWGYRLRWDDGGTTRYSSEAWVDVPTTAFALHPLSPNPSNGDLKVSFTLPDATPATMMLVDVSGRELTRLNVGAFGPGTHVADLAAGRRLPAGVYIVELIQGSRRTTLRASIVR